MTFAAYATSVFDTDNSYWLRPALAAGLVVALGLAHASNHRTSGGTRGHPKCLADVVEDGRTIPIDTGFGDRKQTTWWRVVLFGKRAEQAARMLTKGTWVSVTGEPIAASRAAELGLVNRVTDAGGALDEALRLAGERDRTSRAVRPAAG